MIVELIGTPGAGKTTLVPALTEALAARGISARTVVEAGRPYALRTPLGAAVGRLAPQPLRRPLLWQVFYQASAAYRLRFFARHPRLIHHVLREQRRRPIPAEERRHALSWFFVLAGQYEFLRAHARPGEALVLDEGFAHRAVQMHASDVETPEPARIAAYASLLPRPHLLVAVHAPWEVCVERIYRRGLWERFRHKGRAQVERYVANAHRVVDVAVHNVRRGGWTVIDVDNGGDATAAALAELRTKLAEMVAPGGAAPALGPAALGEVL